MTAIQLDGVVCALGDKLTLEIDRLRVGHGERVAIIGPNGAGKSSLLRMLSGFASPARGSVTVLGRQLVAPGSELRNLRRELGQIHQGLHLVQRLSVLDNVLVGALGRLSGWRTWTRCYRVADVEAAEACLRNVGLHDQAHTRVDRLSGGERQKVAIARMLMQRPRLILADEPTAALDPQAAAEVCALLAAAAQGATLVSVVHNPTLLPPLAERVVGLRDGRIAFDLPLAQVGAPELARLYGQSRAMVTAGVTAEAAPRAPTPLVAATT